MRILVFAGTSAEKADCGNAIEKINNTSNEWIMPPPQLSRPIWSSRSHTPGTAIIQSAAPADCVQARSEVFGVPRDGHFLSCHLQAAGLAGAADRDPEFIFPADFFTARDAHECSPSQLHFLTGSYSWVRGS